MSPGLFAPSYLPGPGRLSLQTGSRGGRRLGLVWRPVMRTASFELPTVPLPIGERDDEPVLVLLVTDESPSEQALDPHGYRHVATRRMVDLLRTELRHKGDRVACVHFSTEPRPWLRPTSPHSRAGRLALRQMLRPVGGGGGTDIRAAIERAADLVPSTWRGLVVVMLLSDGQDGSTADQLVTAVDRFRPGAVHAISIGSSLPAVWCDVPIGSATVVPSLSRPDEVEWAATRVLYQALGLSWSGPDQPPRLQ